MGPINSPSKLEGVGEARGRVYSSPTKGEIARSAPWPSYKGLISVAAAVCEEEYKSHNEGGAFGKTNCPPNAVNAQQ